MALRDASPATLRGLFGTILAVELFCGVVAVGFYGRQAYVAGVELKAARAELIRDRRDFAAFDARRQNAEAVAADLALLEATQPRSLYVPSLVRQLAEAAAQHGLELRGTAPGRDIDDRPLSARLPGGQWRLRATVHGDYAGLLQLVEGFQQAPKALSIEAVRVEADEVGTGRVAAHLVLRAYEPPPVAPAPTPEAPAPAPVLGAVPGQPQGSEPLTSGATTSPLTAESGPAAGARPAEPGLPAAGAISPPLPGAGTIGGPPAEPMAPATQLPPTASRRAPDTSPARGGGQAPPAGGPGIFEKYGTPAFGGGQRSGP